MLFYLALAFFIFLPLGTGLILLAGWAVTLAEREGEMQFPIKPRSVAKDDRVL